MSTRQRFILILDQLRKAADSASKDIPATWTDQEIRWWLIDQLRQQATTAERRKYAAYRNDLLNNPRLS